MITPGKESKREKINFMLNRDILVELKQWIPAGERSDFVNGALQGAIIQFKRERAFKAMDELREKAKIKMTTKEFIRLKNYGRN